MNISADTARAALAAAGIDIADDPRQIEWNEVWVSDEGARFTRVTMYADEWACDEIIVLMRAPSQVPYTGAYSQPPYVSPVQIASILVQALPVSSWTWERVTNDAVTQSDFTQSDYSTLLRVRVRLDVEG